MSAPQPPAPLFRLEGHGRAVAFVLVAALLFAAANVAWRVGDGSTVGIVAVRAALGAVVAWIVVRRQTSQPWWRALTVASGRVAAGVSAATMVAAATMFRTLDGPLAGLAVACTPAVALLVRDRVGTLATAAALGSSAAAVGGLTVAAVGAGPVDVSLAAAGVAVSFVALEVWSMRSSQRAVAQGVDASSVVTATMVLAAVVLAPFAVVDAATEAEPATLLVSVVAAAAVAVLGTAGRILRTVALPAAGVPAVAASAQVTALGTAAGGVVVMGDELTWVGAACAVTAAGLGALAVVSGTRWRMARRAETPAPVPVEPAGAG